MKTSKYIYIYIGFKIIAFLLICAVLISVAQEILTPDWRYPKMVEGVADMVQEFDALNDEDNIQAVFLGASSSEFSIDPMLIYDETGVATFNLSSSGQPQEVSYYLLKRALEKAQVKYVFFEVTMLFREVENFDPGTYRYLLDSMPIGENKIQLAGAYARHYPEEERLGAYISIFVPIYQFHERWKELSSLDFEPKKEHNFFRKGYYSDARINAVLTPIDLMNEISDANYNNVLWRNTYLNGDFQSYVTEEISIDSTRMYDCTIKESALELFLRMKALCEEHGAEIILMKIPQIYLPQYYESWTRLRSDAVKELATGYNVNFIDFVYDVNCGMDYSTDSCDGGAHLNYLGAKKISSYLADFLLNHLNCTPSPCAEYEEDIPIYSTMCQLLDLKTTVDLIPYLEKLNVLENVTVFFSASDDMMLNLQQESRQALNAFGLQTNFDTLSYSDSFLAVKENDNVVYEASSNQRLQYSGQLQNGSPYTITSCGWRLGMESQIIVNGANHSRNTRGINIVVYDNQANLVLDSVTFDTYALDQRAVRSVDPYLRDYEEYLMKKDAENGIGA